MLLMEVDKKPLEFQAKVIYFVPYNLSPASPSPGNIYPISLRDLSREAVKTLTSGWLFFMTSTPSGAAKRHKNLMSFAPFSF